jgi:hypothetical protein
MASDMKRYDFPIHGTNVDMLVYIWKGTGTNITPSIKMQC